MKTITIPGATALKKDKLSKSAARRRENDDRKKLQEALTRDGIRNDLLPRCEITLRRVSELNPAARSIRKLTTAQVERVTRSILSHGFIGAIIVRKNRIVDGHVRLEAAKQAGLTQIPAIDVDHLGEDEARVLAIGLNRIAELGETDFDELKIEMQELLALDFDLTVTGFSAPEIDIISLVEPAAIGAADEEIPEPQEEAVAKLGDFFTLGRHRIGCADALLQESYDHLLSGAAVAAAMLSDPPFNVKIENNVSGLGKRQHGEFVMASGEMTREEFKGFLQTFLTHSARFVMDGGVLFAFIDWRSIHTIVEAALAAGLDYTNMAVWDKGSGSMGAFYRSAHELVPVFCKGKSPASNNIQLGKHGRDRCNIWRYPGANRPGTSAAQALKDHPSPKNVAMIEDAILDVTRRDDIVLDPFLGSGTTIIAAENTGRRCFGLELDPKYVDVCIRRWEQLTGYEAVHVESGLTYVALAELRESPAFGEEA